MAHWHILGPGAIGCLMAYRLTQSGERVTLLGRHRHPTQVSLDYRAPQGASASISVDYQNVAELSAPIERLLITTKSYGTAAALTPLNAFISPATVLLLLQNGMGQHEWLRSRYPQNPLLLGSISHGVRRLAPFQIHHTGFGRCLIGPGSDNASASLISPLLHTEGPELWPVEWQPDIETFLWHKLAVNTAINPLTVYYDCLNGELLDSGAREQHLEQILEEFAVVANALNIAPPDKGYLALAKDVAAATAGNSSSMREDIRAGRPSEINAITGYLLHRAQQLGIPCPYNREMLDYMATISADDR